MVDNKMILLIVFLVSIINANIYTGTLGMSHFGILAYKYEKKKLNENFSERQKRIVDQINSSNTTWNAQYYDRWNYEYFMSLENVSGSTPGNGDFILYTLQPADKKISETYFKEASAKFPLFQDLPKNFSVADNWPECPTLGQISDQSQCKSGWAISSANVMSDRICIHSEGIDNRKVSA